MLYIFSIIDSNKIIEISGATLILLFKSINMINIHPKPITIDNI